MRSLGIVGLCVALGGCLTTSQEVVQQLGANYIGKSTDNLVKDFGPPASSFKLQSGETSYVWQLDSVTHVYGDQYSARASTRYCKVSVVADPKGIVTTLNTEDSDSVLNGSICSRRLGIQRQG
jgi:hypothetical protein